MKPILKNNTVTFVNPVNEMSDEITGYDSMITDIQSSVQVAPVKDLDSLIQGCKRHGRESQRLLYLQYYGFGLKVIYRYAADYSTAIRLTNETMIKIFRSFSSFKAMKHMTLEYSFGRWMKDAFIRAVVVWSRTRVRSEVHSPTPVHTDADIWAPPSAEDMPDTQLYRILITRLVSLPLYHRLIFNLYVIDKYSAGEVVRLSGMRIKSVERYLSEARSILRGSIPGN